MTKKQIEQKQAEANRVYEAAKEILAILDRFDAEQQQELIELVTEDD